MSVLSSSSSVENFISRWQNSGAAERSNYALFLSELCDLLEVERPQPSSEYNDQNDYVIDRAFTRSDKDGNSSTVYLDLYKRGHFVLETKQGSSGTGDKLGHGKRGTKGWDTALDKAYHQARAYIHDLPTAHGRPPFLIVADVGHCFDIYAEFTGTGGTYLAYPNPAKRRIFLEDLKNPNTRQLLRTIWTTPHALDPSKHAAKVTREVADTLAKLAASLEKKNHDPQLVATFLQRILFTLFAEDIGLLPEKSFEEILLKIKDTPQGFAAMVTGLWKEMATGTAFSILIQQEIAYFNGGLFDNPSALPLDTPDIELIIQAAKQDWKEVEPAIFGTFLERALDPTERHKLGAHYTPRSYVDRLIDPALMQPLRKQWDAVKTAAALLHGDGSDTKNVEKAIKQIEHYHHQLCATRVLDPACGSGNFLYVALARMKELEAEVLDLLEALGGNRTLEMDSFKVRPDQFLGLEINQRACAIAQLVLWIGYFQWHHKTTGRADTNDRPLLPKQQTILHQDAVLAYDEMTPRTDPHTGAFLTIWDGRTTKPHPVTGKEVPDESARKPLYDYAKPRIATWPQADYIVGNPPFLGNKRMRDGLGDGYVEALRGAWKKHKPDSWDFVMYWWHHAAELVRDGKAKQFGFITTNSIHQTFNRRCLEPFLNDDKKPVSITFAIPDHPWVDSADGAAVRIAMTVAEKGAHEGELKTVKEEEEQEGGEYLVSLHSKNGKISANLQIGADLLSCSSLVSNSCLSSLGFILGGQGFKIEKPLADKINSETEKDLAYPIHNGNDITDGWNGKWVIDAHGLTEEELSTTSPTAWQHLKNTLYPVRQTNNDPKLRTYWWLFRRANTEYRSITKDLSSYFVTVETAKHRAFLPMSGNNKAEHKLVVIGLSGRDFLSILSSTIHTTWALSNGSQLGPTPVYVKTRCFETFPFPDLDDKPALKEKLRTLGEQLDAHRKARQAEHPDLTLTSIYNVLEKLRKGEPLTDKEKTIHDQGLVTLLKQIHDDIDTTVLEAYRGGGFQPPSPTLEQQHQNPSIPLADRLARGDEELEQAILQSLVDLNHQRAAEEAQGKIRYLRPDFQNPDGTATSQQTEAQLPTTSHSTLHTSHSSSQKKPWPSALPEQVTLIKELTASLGTHPETLSAHFGRPNKKRLTEIDQILQTLTALGQI